MTDKTARIILCAVIYALLALFMLGLYLFNANYSEIYDSPRVKYGEADFAGADITSRDVACNLAGEWEFFYNKWIVTDGDTGEKDGFINLPGLWTYADYGNGRLPPSGYASYRLRVKNLQAGIDLQVFRYYCNFAYRVFVNGELNYRSGTLSKNASETVVTGATAEKRPYRTDGGDLEIVIEISATNSGGFKAAPWLSAVSAGISYGASWRSFYFVALGITTAAVILSVLTSVFFGYKRDITAPLFLASLYAHFLFSRDMMYVFGMQITAMETASLITAVASFVMLGLHLYKSGARINRAFAISTSVTATVSVILLLAFYGTPLAPAFALLLLFTGCAYIVPAVFSPEFNRLRRTVYGALGLLLLSVFWFELCDGLGLLVFGTEFIFTVELMFIIACFVVLWLWKTAKAARTAIRASELECELSAVKRQALTAQIKPHFVYNSLTAIQSRYRDGFKEGDKAIEQFATHMRLITDSRESELIPFEDEVKNVLNYFELENLRANGRLNLYLDLNYTDFSVPVLSVQPLVENAIRHGGLREKEDGYIKLCSDKTEEGISVTVSDNGKGFDINAEHTGVGLENTRQRFESIGAEMQIVSAAGEGTSITIKIQKGGQHVIASEAKQSHT